MSDPQALTPDPPSSRTYAVCDDCGACCASFRVSFYWGEANDAPGGWVPVEFTERLSPYLRSMRGTNAAAPHCDQLAGQVPGARCKIYPQRPSTCHDMQPYTETGEVNAQCNRARARYGLTPVPELDRA